MKRYLHRLLPIFLIVSCYIYTQEDAELFEESKIEFEDNWWGSDKFDICLHPDSESEKLYLLDGFDDLYIYSYRYESPNLYYLDDYTAEIYVNDMCYDILVRPFPPETVCECIR